MSAPEASQERRENVPGTIYLLHFEQPLRHARHYLGFTEGETVDQRIERHRSGRGSKLMAAVTRSGIDFRVVKTWSGTRHLERELKRSKNIPRHCPVCQEGA